MSNNITVTKHELWMQQAPSFNFELNEDELLQKALEKDFVRPTDDPEVFTINPDY